MEIERKYLVTKPIENYNQYPCREIEQAYLAMEPEIRVRKDDDNYFLTYKSTGLLIREEYNLPLTKATYEHLLNKADGIIISKKRYMIPINDTLMIEFDVFSEKFNNLMLAEVEFTSEDDAYAFIPPDWFGKEVTYDSNYKNKNLSKMIG